MSPNRAQGQVKKGTLNSLSPALQTYTEAAVLDTTLSPKLSFFFGWYSGKDTGAGRMKEEVNTDAFGGQGDSHKELSTVWC